MASVSTLPPPPAPIAGSVRYPLLERAVALELWGGVLVSAPLLVLGALLVFIGGIGTLSPSPPTHLTTGLSAGAWGAGLLYGGVLVLALTPVARVGVSAVLFAIKRDFRFTVITLTVFVLLVTTAVGGIYG